MSPLSLALLTHFMPTLLAGMTVNFEIAAIALVLGLGSGSVLALVRYRGGIAGKSSGLVVGLMRAAPTFVVMFFLLNALPRSSLSGTMIVAVSLVPYAAAYVADSGVDALRQYHEGSHLACLLILPNIARAFFVLVMSSSAGAAIGVPEAISMILRQAQKLHSIGGMLVLFMIGIVCFGVPMQLGFAAVRMLQRRLARLVVNASARALPPVSVAPAE